MCSSERVPYEGPVDATSLCSMQVLYERWTCRLDQCRPLGTRGTVLYCKQRICVVYQLGSLQEAAPSV